LNVKLPVRISNTLV